MLHRPVEITSAYQPLGSEFSKDLILGVCFPIAASQ